MHILFEAYFFQIELFLLFETDCPKLKNSKNRLGYTLIFDPTLNGNKLSLKILNVHSFYLEECPLFSEVPFKFNLNQIDKSGLDVLFYG